MNLKQKIRNVDKILIVSVLILSVIGVIGISSAKQVNITSNFYYVYTQITWVIIGMAVMSITAFFNFNTYDESTRNLLSIIAYISNILMLGLVLVLGTSSNGSSRWIYIGSMGFQPSEFAKIIMIFCMASFLTMQEENINKILYLILNIILLLIPMALISMQPDLSSSLIFVMIFAAQIFVSKLNYKYILSIAVISIPILVLMLWYIKLPEQKILKPYQKTRILALIEPEKYARAEAYQTTKSIQAIGSGQMNGKGIYKGTLNKANYLPEPHTDFIFSVIAEELGFTGCITIILLYLIMIYRCIRTVADTGNMFLRLMITGIVVMISTQIFVNIGVATGIIPNTGIPLPFISYGGSSYLVNSFAIGIILNISINRKKQYSFQ